MNVNAPPRVATSVPRNYAIDVATDLSMITVGFTTDLDPTELHRHIRLQSKEGHTVPTNISYRYRTVTIEVREHLSPNMQYQLILFGDSNLENDERDGIRSAIGVSMQGNAVIHFTTAKEISLPPPVGLYPSNQTIVQTVPAFNWEQVEGAVRYEIQVSKTASMQTIHWVSNGVSNPPVYPSVPFSDGPYYWRVRAVNIEGRISEWSETYSFHLDTIQESPVVEEDTVSPELEYDRLHEYDDTVEVISMFPQEEASNLATNLETIYFVVLGAVRAEDVAISMTGEAVLGDGEDHGDIPGTIEIIPQEDGSTLIAYTPEPLQNPTN